jgi:N6-adenosine-specific RNA methylase IME4
VTPTGTADAAAALAAELAGQRFGTILADPPWQFVNRTGKVAPEHRRLGRYGTLDLAAIARLPVADHAAPTAHLYLWVPNALLPDGLAVMKEWGFAYKANIVWHKIRKDGGPDGRGVGFYFRNVTELLLFGVRGPKARTLELFARGPRPGWTVWGNQAAAYQPDWLTYAHNSQSERARALPSSEN